MKFETETDAADRFSTPLGGTLTFGNALALPSSRTVQNNRFHRIDAPPTKFYMIRPSEGQ